MNRRIFGKMTLLSVAGMTLLATSCSVLTDIEDWSPIGLVAFKAILLVLTGAGIPLPGLIVNVIEQSFADVIADIKAYQETPPVGTLATIDEVLSLLLSNIQGFISSLVISDSNILNLVVGMIGVIVSTISGFINDLPASVAIPKSRGVMARKFSVSGVTISTVPVKRNTRQFKEAWNKVTADHSNLQLAMSRRERWHLTGK